MTNLPSYSADIVFTIGLVCLLVGFGLGRFMRRLEKKDWITRTLWVPAGCRLYIDHPIGMNQFDEIVIDGLVHWGPNRAPGGAEADRTGANL